MAWPNFFIVGAPRAGTTSVYEHLSRHPDVYMSPVKEPHFFCRYERTLLRMNQVSEEEDYLRLFDGAQGRPAIGEASTHYLYDVHACMNIRRTVPDAKIIILLREPVDRAYSHYLRYRSLGLETRSFLDAIREDSRRPHKIPGAAFLYLELGLYYEQVKRYLETFGSGRIRIYLFEELLSNPKHLMDNICSFLEVPPRDIGDVTRAYNVFAPPRNKLFLLMHTDGPIRSAAHFLLPKQVRALIKERMLTKRQERPPLDPEARAQLGPICVEDILRLQSLIGRDLSKWLV